MVHNNIELFQQDKYLYIAIQMYIVVEDKYTRK